MSEHALPARIIESTTLVLPRALPKATELEIDETCTHDDWLRIGQTLSRIERASQWWIGDWVRFGERKWGEKYDEAIKVTGLEYQAIANYAWVASNVSTRVETLSWSHHREVAALDPADQEAWLERAVDNGWKVRELKQHIRSRKAEDPPPLPDGTYQCLVIDPPWYVEKIERDVRPNQGSTLDYPMMTLDEIADLDVPSLAAPDCHLYLWTTHKYLPAALALTETWGFTYQCLMTWNKNVGITPFSWMYDTEHVVFAKKGSLPLEQLGLRLSFSAPVTRHSAKPDVFYERVLAASPGPRLEMFARNERDGFTAWGNEIQADAA